MKGFPIVITLGLLLVGCATTISGTLSTAVNREMPNKGNFYVLPEDSISLTANKIKQELVSHMKQLGYQQVEEGGDIDFVLLYNYTVGAGESQLVSLPDYTFGGRQYFTLTQYPRYFQITIVDLKASDIPNKIVVVTWQGEVYSTGGSDNIAWLSKFFIDALFDHFNEQVENVNFKVTPEPENIAKQKGKNP